MTAHQPRKFSLAGFVLERKERILCWHKWLKSCMQMEHFLPVECSPGFIREPYFTYTVPEARLQETLTMFTDPPDDTGIVFRKTLGHYTVHANGREIDCTLSSLIHKQLIYSAADPTSMRRRVQNVREIEHVDPVAIGDRVRFINASGERGLTPFPSEQPGKASGVIVEVLPRRSRLSRPAPVPGQRVFEQVIVTNADQVLPIFSAASPTPKWGLLDRYLVAAEAAGLPAAIVITKLDLAWKNPQIEQALEMYRSIGYPTLLVSTVTGEGLDGLKSVLQNKTSVLVGKSGVGKTSLLNAIRPGLGLRVRAVSSGETGKGRHTTTHYEMFDLDFGGALVDTPGMREFGLWDITAEELASLFPEMADSVGKCKFGLSCRHDNEPGCAIRKAVMAGTVSPYRYRSYLRLLEEL
jgi:ribosome biogenesis GTPase